HRGKQEATASTPTPLKTLPASQRPSVDPELDRELPLRCELDRDLEEVEKLPGAIELAFVEGLLCREHQPGGEQVGQRCQRAHLGVAGDALGNSGRQWFVEFDVDPDPGVATS